MADEYATPPVSRVTNALSDQREPGQRGAPPRGGGGQGGEPGGTLPGFDDSANVHGVPEDELTEAVQAALADLMAEIDRLREQVRQYHERIERLEGEVEAHPFLPVKSRRGLIHALHRLLPRIADGQMSATLLCLHVGGVERLRRRHGLAASDAALRHVATVLAQGMRQTDVVANIGAYDFAILMPLADTEAAHEKGRAVAARLQAAPFRWGGGEHSFAVAWGAAQVAPDQPLEAILEAAAPRLEAEEAG